MKTQLALRSWTHDLCGCLQIDAACVLSFYGYDPVEVLGAAWRFAVRPGDWEPTEYFCPAIGGDLGSFLTPYHPISWEWRYPAPDRIDRDLHDSLLEGVPPIVAVDNYYLPFRPAYRDVHAAHLVLVRGANPDADTFDVLDPLPPSFEGTLPGGVLRASRCSDNHGEDRDPFFAGKSIGGRWLALRVAAELPSLTEAWLDRILGCNRSALADCGSAQDGYLTGLAGLEAYLDGAAERARRGDECVMRELYVTGWPLQAAAALHADFLALAGTRLGRLELREAGRWVDMVAHEWTALRMTAAHGLADPRGTSAVLQGLCRRLVMRWREALSRIDDARHGRNPL